MTEELELKVRGPQTVKSLKEEIDPQINELQAEVNALRETIQHLTNGVIQSFHVIGAPHDILLKNGLEPYKVKKRA